jgi:hypothetical protein
MTHHHHPLGRSLLQKARSHAAAAALLVASATAAAAPLDDLRRQVEGSQFDQAWQTAQANPQLLGTPEFDFLFGLAALGTGRTADGVLALERHLQVTPGDDRARLELARGYFLLGDYYRARTEFEFLLRANPPAGVRTSIGSYLQAMQLRDGSDQRANARFYVEFGGGYDSNVNLGTFHSAAQVGSEVVDLTGSPSLGQSDGFAQLQFGGQQQLRVSNRMTVFAGADVDHRPNFKRHDFDLSTAGLYIGFTNLAGNTLWRGTLGSSELRVGGNRFRDLMQASLEANVTLTQELSVLGFGQFAESRHAGADDVRNAYTTTLGVMVTRSFSDLASEPVLGARLSYQQETNLKYRHDLSKKSPTLRVFGSFGLMPGLRASLALTAYREDYDAEDIGFQSTRHDTGASADASLTYALDNRWSLRAEGSWLRGNSNQDLYDKTRKSAALKLRYQF